MPHSRQTAGSSPLQVLIVDEHDVYRAACAALLRTEGLEVSEAAPRADIVGFAHALEPNVVLIDAAPPAAWLLEIVRQLRSLAPAPTVVLISSSPHDGLDPSLVDLPFLAKADVSARELFRAMHHGCDEPASQMESE